MYTRLGSEILKTGEVLEVGVVAGPDPEWQPRIEPFLSHKGPGWNDHIQRALREPLDELQTLFYVGTISGELVTQVMIVGHAGAGILGHVFTKPDHRRKGAYRHLMAHQMRDVSNRGFRVLTLGMVNPQRMVDEEVKKSLAEIGTTVRASLWWVSVQIALRVLFGLTLWTAWALHG